MLWVVIGSIVVDVIECLQRYFNDLHVNDGTGDGVLVEVIVYQVVLRCDWREMVRWVGKICGITRAQICYN